jgi:hypothetical protein
MEFLLIVHEQCQQFSCHPDLPYSLFQAEPDAFQTGNHGLYWCSDGLIAAYEFFVL